MDTVRVSWAPSKSRGGTEAIDLLKPGRDLVPTGWH
jgi:hypothetical protein